MYPFFHKNAVFTASCTQNHSLFHHPKVSESVALGHFKRCCSYPENLASKIEILNSTLRQSCGIYFFKSAIEDQVLSMYAKSMTTRDISEHLASVYGVDASVKMISHMTDHILTVAKEWQNRPLERKYAIVFMGAVHFHVSQITRQSKSCLCSHRHPSERTTGGP